VSEEYASSRHFDELYPAAGIGFYSDVFGVSKNRRLTNCECCGTKTYWRDTALNTAVCSEKCQYSLLYDLDAAFDADVVEEWQDEES
jgi:endogenous inhibitor of DNA gyrase (YacG/DUF329 family)